MAGQTVEELLRVERQEALEHSETNATSTKRTDDLAFEVVRVLGDGSDVPVTSHDLLVRGNEVADEEEDRHENVLSDGDDCGSASWISN